MKRKPYKLNDNKKAAYLGAISNGLGKQDAAKSIGVSRQTIWEHAKTDPAFAEAIADAELDACEQVEDVLYQTALNGNLKAIMFWLCNRCPERWQWRPKPAVEQTTPMNLEDLVRQINSRLEGLPD